MHSGEAGERSKMYTGSSRESSRPLLGTPALKARSKVFPFRSRVVAQPDSSRFQDQTSSIIRVAYNESNLRGIRGVDHP